MQTIAIFFIGFLLHFVFMMLGSSQLEFYPEPITLQQWFISIGIAMTVFLASFLVRLLPEAKHSSVLAKVRINRTTGLGVKLVSKR